MIDSDKLPTAAVEAAQAVPYLDFGEPDDRGAIAAFLDALLADDSVMRRAVYIFHQVQLESSTGASIPAMRAALTAAVQEP